MVNVYFGRGKKESNQRREKAVIKTTREAVNRKTETRANPKQKVRQKLR